jgi:membrane peptidoglycan carboxypeptidase
MSSRPRARGRAARATGHAAQGVALLLSFVLIAGIGGVLAAGLALPAVALANGATSLTTQTFNDLPTDLSLTTLPQKSVILAADGTQLATFYDQNRVIVPLSAIAPILQKAVISVEDKRFYEHSGIDPQGMLRALAKTQFGDQTQGASTLTQQYIKNVQLQAAETIDDPVARAAAIKAATDSTGTDGYARKLREAKLAISLERRMSKDQILEAYLNIAQFGASSIYGVEAAAEYYFGGTHASDLSYLQAATIAGITQSPSKWDPVLHPDQAQIRRNIVLGTMHDQGYITDAEYHTGIATPIASTLNPKPVQQGCMKAGANVPGSGFFCDYVTKVILNDPAFGKDQTARQQLLYRGGLTITTTLVPGEQALAVKSVDDKVPPTDPSGVSASMVVVEPGTGKITSMAQNRDYSAVQNPGPGLTAVNWNTSSSYGGSAGFPPGSSFKPFTLVEWLKSGHNLMQTFDGTLRPIALSSFAACGKPYARTGTYEYGNSEGNGGFMNAIDATRLSVNSAYLAMGAQLDLCNIMQDAADLGVVQPGGKGMGKPIAPRPANIIGSDNVTPLAMASAYAAFAANGTYCAPIAITRVLDDKGKDMAVPSANCQEKLEPRIASAVNYTLKNVWKGTAAALGVPSYPAGGKTGTTSRAEDIWFVGYTPLRAAAAWVGHDDGMRPMNGLKINGITYSARRGGPYGADIPGPIWREFMDQFMAGKTVADFPAPGSKEVYGDIISVPSVVGLPQDQATAALQGAGFQVRISATTATDPSPAGTVVSQSPSGRAPRGSTITLTLSDGQGQQPQPTNNGNGNPPATPPGNSGNNGQGKG